MDQYRYYLVKGGKALEAIEKWQESHKVAQAELVALREEIGASGAYRLGNGVCAFTFDGDAPRGWIRATNTENGYKPAKRSEEGKAIAKRMNAIRFPDCWTFMHLIKLDFARCGASPRGGHRVLLPTFEHIKGQWVIKIAVDEEGKSETCPGEVEELKASEYWRIKEEAEAGA